MYVYVCVHACVCACRDPYICEFVCVRARVCVVGWLTGELVGWPFVCLIGWLTGLCVRGVLTYVLFLLVVCVLMIVVVCS